MKKKNIIICIIGAVVLAGAYLVVAYTLDGVSTVAPEAPAEEQLEAVEDAEQEWQSKVDIIAQAMAENGNFTEDSIRSVKEKNLNINALYDFRDMNEEQMKEYVAHLSQVNRYQRGFGLGYLRIRAEILGKMSANGPRLTVEALDGLVSQSHSREELYSSIRAQYGEADFVPTSSLSIVTVEYWLNDEGTDWLLMEVGSLENGAVRQVGLGHYDSDKGVKGELLYSTDDLKALYSAAE